MKVLFLDIDGVLNGHEKHPDSPYTTIRPDCIQRLNRVVAQTECKIVISSAWRYMLFRKGRKPAPMTLLGFQYMLYTHGLVGAVSRDLIIGHTCSDEIVSDRGDQVIDWATDHCLEPDEWAVVDDDPMEMELGKYRDRLVRTNGKTGMTDATVRRLVKLLGKAEVVK